MLVDDFAGIRPTASAFHVVATSLGGDLHRLMIVDANGRIEEFAASNTSAVLAQPTAALSLSRPVSLKAAVGDSSGDGYIVSDPFVPILDALDQLVRSETFAASIASINAMRVLSAARQEGLLPSRALPGEAGIFLYFSSGTKYAEVECDTDGDIAIVVSDRTGLPSAWFGNSHQLRSDLARIRAFLV